jgi:hypothetical protein
MEGDMLGVDPVTEQVVIEKKVWLKNSLSQ